MANNHSAGTIQLPAVSGATVFDIDGHKYVAAVFNDMETLQWMRDAVFSLVQGVATSKQSFDITEPESVYYALELIKSITPKNEVA